MITIAIKLEMKWHKSNHRRGADWKKILQIHSFLLQDLEVSFKPSYKNLDTFLTRNANTDTCVLRTYRIISARNRPGHNKILNNSKFNKYDENKHNS